MCSSGLRGVLDSSPTKPIGMQLNYLSCREWSNDHDKQTWSEYIIHVRYKHTNQCFLFVEMREDTYETYMSINEQTKEERKNHPVPPDTFDIFIWEALVHHFNDNDAKKRRLEITRVQ